MGRLKKSVRASRTNGALAKNKGLAVDVKKELFGGYSPGGTYHIRTVDVRRTMAKGEIRGPSVGCEHDVFTYCLYHGSFLRFGKGEQPSKQRVCKTKYGPVDLNRWDDARKKAAQMLEQCADMDPKAKADILRKRAKGAKVRINFDA